MGLIPIDRHGRFSRVRTVCACNRSLEISMKVSFEMNKESSAQKVRAFKEGDDENPDVLVVYLHRTAMISGDMEVRLLAVCEAMRQHMLRKCRCD